MGALATAPSTASPPRAVSAAPRPWPAPVRGVVGAPCARLDLHRTPPAVVSLPAEDDWLIVVAPLRHPIRVSSDQASVPVTLGRGLVVQSANIELRAPHGAEVALLRLPRSRFQGWLCAHYSRPRRLARALTGLDDVRAVLALVDCTPGRDLPDGVSVAPDDSDAACEALVAALNRIGETGIWRSAPALERAVDYILHQFQGDCAPETVADRAGMTLKTLQRQAQDVLGASLAAFIRDVRLTAARTALVSGTESRSIADLARAFGFVGGSAFARAYGRRFGETPTRERALAVHSAR